MEEEKKPPKFCTRYLVEHYRMVVDEQHEQSLPFVNVSVADLAAMCDYMAELETLQAKHKSFTEKHKALEDEHVRLGKECIRLGIDYEVLKKNFLM